VIEISERLLEKLTEVRDLALLELVRLVDEIVKDDIEKSKILNFEYNSIVWAPKMGEGKIRGYELRVYEKTIDKTGKQRVRQRYVASYPANEEIKRKLERLSYLYRLVRLIDHEPKRGAIFRT